MKLRIKEKREQSGMTQEEVAQACEITAGSYGHYETGIRTPTPYILKKIADVFECKVDDLIETEDPK